MKSSIQRLNDYNAREHRRRLAPEVRELHAAQRTLRQLQRNNRTYSKLGFSIHNYFFAKVIDQVRPGGVIRLPNNAFRANAGMDSHRPCLPA